MKIPGRLSQAQAKQRFLDLCNANVSDEGTSLHLSKPEYGFKIHVSETRTTFIGKINSHYFEAIYLRGELLRIVSA